MALPRTERDSFGTVKVPAGIAKRPHRDGTTLREGALTPDYVRPAISTVFWRSMQPLKRCEPASEGGGFAVVADEVRKLAERSARYTEQIMVTEGQVRRSAETVSAAMEETVGRASASVTRTDDAGDAVRKIGESSQHTVEMIGEIADAIKEQSRASQSVAQIVEHIARMAEQSSVAAGNSATSASELDELATGMQNVIDGYKL